MGGTGPMEFLVVVAVGAMALAIPVVVVIVLLFKIYQNTKK
jgi:hypothetical protein